MLFWGCIVICDLYLFHFTVLLNLDFFCFKSFLSFSVDKVITGTYNFVSVIWNLEDVGEISLRAFVIVLMLVITQILDQVKTNSISQLINGISKVLQKLLNYFNGTAISTFFCTRFVNTISRTVNSITFCIGNFCINIISTSYSTCLVFKRCWVCYIFVWIIITIFVSLNSSM